MRSSHNASWSTLPPLQEKDHFASHNESQIADETHIAVPKILSKDWEHRLSNMMTDENVSVLST